jgi:hypothetical protein
MSSSLLFRRNPREYLLKQTPICVPNHNLPRPHLPSVTELASSSSGEK